MLSVYSDESGFPHASIQSLACIVGTQEECSALRTRLQVLLEKVQIEECKYTKIRAKKKLFLLAQDILSSSVHRTNTTTGAIFLFTWKEMRLLYTSAMAHIIAHYPDISIAFFPDKNLTLQRHTSQHIFTDHPSIVQTQPVLVRDESLIMIADLYAGIARARFSSPSTRDPWNKIDHHRKLLDDMVTFPIIQIS